MLCRLCTRGRERHYDIYFTKSIKVIHLVIYYLQKLCALSFLSNNYNIDMAQCSDASKLVKYSAKMLVRIVSRNFPENDLQRDLSIEHFLFITYEIV